MDSDEEKPRHLYFVSDDDIDYCSHPDRPYCGQCKRYLVHGDIFFWLLVTKKSRAPTGQVDLCSRDCLIKYAEKTHKKWRMVPAWAESSSDDEACDWPGKSQGQDWPGIIEDAAEGDANPNPDIGADVSAAKAEPTIPCVRLTLVR